MTLLSEIAGAMRANHLRYDEGAGRAELMRRVQAKSRPVERFGRVWQSRFANILALIEPKLAVALLVIVIQGAVLGQMVLGQGKLQFSEVRSSPPLMDAEAPAFRVNFRPDASEHDIRMLLISAGARIVGGPTQLGDYYLLLPDSEASHRATMLENSALVDSFEKLARLPADLAIPH